MAVDLMNFSMEQLQAMRLVCLHLMQEANEKRTKDGIMRAIREMDRMASWRQETIKGEIRRAGQ